MARENMALDAMKIAGDYDFTLIDGPPHADTISRSCIVASDLVIVPIEPGGASRWSSDLTVRQLKEAQALKPALKCGFVVSRKISGTVLGRDARAMASDAGIPIFDTEIEQRVAYAEALTMGKTVFEWGGNSAAVREIQALTHEVLDALKADEQVILSSTKAAAVNG
jgi:chromosome partitioning protein